MILEGSEVEVSPLHCDVVAVMDLEHDTSGLRSYKLIIDFDHRLAVEPSLYLVALYAETESIPLALLEDVFFLVRNLNKPAASV